MFQINGLDAFDALTWNGNGFAESAANAVWSLLPDQARTVAETEIKAGNRPTLLQFDQRTQVALLAFALSPLSPLAKLDGVTVHRSHSYGNYCYEGTFCTYEFSSPTAFLAFNAPEVLDASREGVGPSAG